MGGALKEASSVAELAAEGSRDEEPTRSTDGPACMASFLAHPCTRYSAFCDPTKHKQE